MKNNNIAGNFRGHCIYLKIHRRRSLILPGFCMWHLLKGSVKISAVFISPCTYNNHNFLHIRK